MKKSVTTLGIAAYFAFGLLSSPASAHHSFGHYAMSETSEIEGIVSKFEWSNPHCWLFVDVPKDGKTVTYGFELQSVGEMLRRNWKKTSIKPGEKLKVRFRPMRDGTPAGLMISVEKDGQRIGAIPGAAPPPPPTTP